MAAADGAEESPGTGWGKRFCRGVPVLTAQLIMAELSVQTPSECIPSQRSRASSELPLTCSDVTLPPQPISITLCFPQPLPLMLWPCLSFLLSSLYSHSLACLPTLPLPHFLPPCRHHAFLIHSI